MRKILFALIAAFALCSCEKHGNLQQGTYSASVTAVGMLNIQLLSDEKCILYFTGGPESSGYYHLNGDNITIIGGASTTDDYGSRKYDTINFSSDNPGTIYSKTSFGVYGESVKTGKTYYCSFTKR